MRNTESLIGGAYGRRLLVARDERSWLDCECNLRSVDPSDDLLEVESMAPVLREQVRYKGAPSYQPCKMDIKRLRDNSENRFVRNVYSRGTHCHIATSSSKGRQLNLSRDEREQVALHVSALLTAGLIQKWRRTAFISYPFVVPKASGESWLIVDFAHLQGKYTKPILHMPAFPAVLRRLHPLEQGDYMVRIDLRSSARFSKQAWGYLAFWLFALELSSIARLLKQQAPRPVKNIGVGAVAIAKAARQNLGYRRVQQCGSRGCADAAYLQRRCLRYAYIWKWAASVTCCSLLCAAQHSHFMRQHGCHWGDNSPL